MGCGNTKPALPPAGGPGSPPKSQSQATSNLLPTAPPYEWGKTYAAAAHIEDHLPGLLLPLGVTTKETKAGFDVLSRDGVRLASLAVAQKSTKPLQAGDPVVLSKVKGRTDLEGVAA